MVFAFAALPPEVNSAFLYTGAGSGPLLAASTAWSNLAAELSTTATSWDSIIGTLTGEQWTGAGSAAAAAAAQPYVSWLTQTSAAAEQAAAQAQASAAAYEAAFAGVVPPPLIAANRSLLATLVATNFLGINTPAIAATEAQYAEMWVQDAVTLTTYEAASTAAAVLQPLTPAAPTTSPAAAATQSLAVTKAATATPAATGLQGILSGLLSGDPSSIGTGLFNALPVPVQNLLNAADGFFGTPLIFDGVQEVGVTAAWFVGNTIPTAVSLGHTLAAAAPAAVSGVSSVTPLAGAAAIGEGTLVNSVMGSGASAALGGSTAVGGLSVPAAWSSAAPATLASSTAPLEGSGWTAATDEAGGGPVGGMMPGMAAAGKGAGAMAGPRYGFKPIVMPKQVVV
jgi:PPE-repeat protein